MKVPCPMLLAIKEIAYLATFRTSSMEKHNCWMLWLVMRSTVVVQATKYSWKVTRTDVFLKETHKYFGQRKMEECIIIS